MIDRTAQEMNRELESLIARRDIMDCISRYMRGQDRLDAELQKSAFHADAFIDCGPVSGTVEEFVAYAQRSLAQCEFTHHMIGQTDIKIDGDRAAGEIYFIAYHRIPLDGEAKDMLFGGRYIDVYTRRAGHWAIESRYELADWTRTEPPADRFFELEPKLRRGARDKSDLSYTIGNILIS